MNLNEYGQISIGKDAAIALAESGWWESKTSREIATFQMMTSELCMPFDVFHKAIEEALGRPVWTHEFGMNFKGIMGELMNGDAPPTMEQIINLIPEDKRIVINLPSTEGF